MVKYKYCRGNFFFFFFWHRFYTHICFSLNTQSDLSLKCIMAFKICSFPTLKCLVATALRIRYKMFTIPCTVWQIMYLLTRHQLHRMSFRFWVCKVLSLLAGTCTKLVTWLACKGLMPYPRHYLYFPSKFLLISM